MKARRFICITQGGITLFIIDYTAYSKPIGPVIGLYDADGQWIYLVPPFDGHNDTLQGHFRREILQSTSIFAKSDPVREALIRF